MRSPRVAPDPEAELAAFMEQEKKRVTTEVLGSQQHDGLRNLLGEEKFLKYKALFNEIDTDQSGAIDKAEMMAALGKQGVKVRHVVSVVGGRSLQVLPTLRPARGFLAGERKGYRSDAEER